MKPNIVILLLVTGVLSIAQETVLAQPENGIYLVVSDTQGRQVERSSGGTIYLGQLVSRNLGDGTMWSLTNQNDRFRLCMQQAGPFDVQHRLAVCANGVCEIVASYYKPDDAGKDEAIVDISGRQNALRIAAGLGVELTERTHPGHQLRVTWKPIKERFETDEPILVALEIKNVGAQPVRFFEGGKQRGARDNQFGFTAYAASGHGAPVADTGATLNHGGKARPWTLKPGATFQKQVDIAKWFRFEKPDVYRITGTYQLELHDETFAARQLWEDFATGQFLLTIRSSSKPR